MLSFSLGTVRRSYNSVPSTMSSGRHTLAFQKAWITSSPLLARSISFGSFIDNRAILQVPAGRMWATLSAASRPALSSSNITTTSCHEESHSSCFLKIVLADCAPLGSDTTGHLLPWSWLTVRQSISPSVMTSFLPPLGHKF